MATKELSMTKKAVRDRKRIEAIKNGTWKPRQLSQSRDNVLKRERYRQKRLEEKKTSKRESSERYQEDLKKTYFPETANAEPDLDKLTRKELKKLVLESRNGVQPHIPIPLKCRSESDPNVTKILHTDLAKFTAQKKDLEEANAQIEVLKAQQSTDLAIINERNAAIEQLNSLLTVANESIREKDSTITQLRSEIQIARRQRDDANNSAKSADEKLREANEFIEKMNESRKGIDQKISDLGISMGLLNQARIRWKTAFLAALIVAVTAVSIAVYFIHR